MPNLTLLGWMFLAWGIITAGFVLLMIYRSVIGLKESDLLFLDAAESRFEEQQKATLSKLARTGPYAKGLGYASGSLIVAMCGLVVYLCQS